MTALEPRDVQPARLPIIPDPPKRGAINNLKRALAARGSSQEAEFALSEEAAEAVARSVPQPDETRKVALKRVSYLGAPAGTFTILRDLVNVLTVATYPLNPRVLETERYPAAEGAPAESGQLYWAQSDLGEKEGVCELVLDGGSRARVKNTLQTHSKSVRQQNPLDSIRDYGVMRPIMLVPMRVRTNDGAPDRVVLASVEGSSRTAYVQALHGIDPADPLYGAVANPDVVAAMTRALAGVREAPLDEVTEDDVVKARSLLVPAEIVIGFTPAEDAERPTLRDGVDGLLALTHIDHPKEWSAAAVDQAIGDKVLAALSERGEIDSDAELRYLAGLMPADDAHAAGFDAWPARRAARIAHLLTRAPASAAGRAISEGVRRASFQKRATRPLKAQVAAALALRAVPDGTVDAHKALRSALSRALELQGVWEDPRRPGSGDWAATDRSPEELRDLALAELDDEGAAGPAARELAVLAAWVLTRHEVLRRGRTRGTREGTDPRDPQTLLGDMMRTRHGIQTLYRAVRDDLDGLEAPRRVDLATFEPDRAAGGGWAVMTEAWIRGKVVPYTAATASDGAAGQTPVRTPQERFDTALREAVERIVEIPERLRALERVTDDSGRSMLTRDGIDDHYAQRLQTTLLDALTFVRRYNEVHRDRFGISVSEDHSEDDSNDGAEA